MVVKTKAHQKEENITGEGLRKERELNDEADKQCKLSNREDRTEQWKRLWEAAKKAHRNNSKCVFIPKNDA